MANVIGQLRYTGELGECVEDLPFIIDYYDKSQNDAAESSSSFRDIIIKRLNNAKFEPNQDYYFKIMIPQDINYALNFTVKLIKDQGSTVYQFLTSKEIPAGHGSKELGEYAVCLYQYGTRIVEKINPDTGEKENVEEALVRATIPIDYVSGMTVNDIDLYRKSNGKLYLGRDLNTPIDKILELNMIPSWEQDDNQAYGTLELAFRPAEAGFMGILLELHRIPEDYMMQTTIGDKTYPGRVVDINKVKKAKVVLQTVKNLIHKIGVVPTPQLNRVGVWGRPGLKMIINGEELRVGPTGYYEIDVLPVQSVGIVANANDYGNNWTMDYTYDDATQKEGN